MIRATIPSIPDHIRVLERADVRSLRLLWDSRFSPREIEQVLERGSSLSVWNTRSGEYLIGGPWRHRREISTILELGATGGAIDLVHAYAKLSAEVGQRMVIVSEQAERRKREFYETTGFVLTEEIIIYELVRVRPAAPRLAGLTFRRFDITDRAVLDDLLALDHLSFPWLWWNSEDEFREYITAPGVEIDVARDATGRMVAYTGTTRYRSWGHLDRVAVAPDLQGRGLGRAALDFAVMSLARDGARRVGLSTQARNTRSRALYESYGFRRATSHDYRLYGRQLDTITDAAEQEEG
jgi:ribosomal protein S18 acetylase RimI-like enzyme